jgi:hypothetical protein
MAAPGISLERDQIVDAMLDPKLRLAQPSQLA